MKNNTFIISLILILLSITPTAYSNDEPVVSIEKVAPQFNDYLFRQLELAYKVFAPKAPDIFGRNLEKGTNRQSLKV